MRSPFITYHLQRDIIQVPGYARVGNTLAIGCLDVSLVRLNGSLIKVRRRRVQAIEKLEHRLVLLRRPLGNNQVVRVDGDVVLGWVRSYFESGEDSVRTRTKSGRKNQALFP